MIAKKQSEAAKLTWERTKAAEKNFRKKYGKDWATYSRGWPDFIAFNKKTGDFCFVECKRKNEIRDRADKILKDEQNKIKRILEKIVKKRLRYEIWFFENKKGSKKIVKKAFCDINKLHFY